MTEEQYRELIRSDDACLHGIAELKTQMMLVVRLLNGNPDEDIMGIRPRLRLLETKFENLPPDLSKQLTTAVDEIRTLKTEWQNLQQRYVGAKWALGLLGVSNLVTLAALARFLLGLG